MKDSKREIPPAAAEIRFIGMIRSPLRGRDEAPKQGREARIRGEIEIYPRYAEGLNGLAGLEHVFVFTWMDRADRDILRVHPRGDVSQPKRGVFSTRSPDRPNPLGMTLVRVLRVEGNTMTVEGMDALDRTPVVDIKPFIAKLDCPDERKE